MAMACGPIELTDWGQSRRFVLTVDFRFTLDTGRFSASQRTVETGRFCCKTILSGPARNIDSRPSAKAQY
jgi:hypothetical protein